MLHRISYSVKLMFRDNHNSERISNMKEFGVWIHEPIDQSNKIRMTTLVRAQYSVPGDNGQKSTDF